METESNGKEDIAEFRDHSLELSGKHVFLYIS